ncbi:hypothetical protein [Reyranella sp.]|uniref:hypothetical protein n=1 Tax=Reyranella sp. TaxID=1929291 RepID=UPI003C7DA490
MRAPLRALAASCLALSLLAACAAPPVRPSAMVPDLAGLPAGPAPAYRQSISAAPVGGGPGASPAWTAAIDTAQFQAALGSTLQAAGLGGLDGGRFRLDATLVKLERPFAGYGMTVEAVVAYRLTDTVTGAVVYDATLATPGTATLDDAIDNNTRLVLANERAVQANLRRLVEALYALPDRPLASPRR